MCLRMHPEPQAHYKCCCVGLGPPFWGVDNMIYPYAAPLAPTGEMRTNLYLFFFFAGSNTLN